MQPRRVRGTGTSEVSLAADLERLRQAILDTYKDSYDYTEYQSRVAAYDGYEYIARRKNTLGDSPDALYYAAGYLPMWELGNPEDELTMGPNDFLVVYGPRHDVTGKATYTNVNVYASEKVMFSMASVYSDTFGGCVDEYIGAGDPAAGMMYAKKFAYPGHCSGEHCSQLLVPAEATTPKNCIFCKIVRGEIPAQKAYEDDLVVAFHDIRPVRPVHVLVIPKEHVASLADCGPAHEAVLGRMLAVAPRLARELGAAGGFRTLVNTGRDGRQEVYHLHMHVIGGRDTGPMIVRT